MPEGRMEWIHNSHHFLFEKVNEAYEMLRKVIVDYGIEATSQLKNGVMNALYRADVFEVQSKVKTIQNTEFSPMTQSSLSFFDDFEIFRGVPVFVLHPPDYEQQFDKVFVPSSSMKSQDSAGLLGDMQFPQHVDPKAVTCSTFSTDVSLLVSGHQDGSIMVWDAEHGKLKKVLAGPHEQAISDLVFYKDSSQHVIACDFSGLMTIWDVTDNTKEPVIVNCSANWEKTRMPSVEGHWPKLSRHGDLLMCPIQVVLEKRPNHQSHDGRDLEKKIFTLPSVGRFIGEKMTKTTGKARDLFAHYCILHIFDTRGFGITKDVPFGDEEGKTYCWGKSVEIPPVSKIFIPLLADAHDYALSCTEISNNSQGLLIGASSRPDGHVIMWPDFQEKPMHSYRMNGMVARWSPCDKFIASWDAPLKNTQKSEEGGVCRLWDVEAATASAERSNQNEDDEHPRYICQSPAVLQCPSGNNIYWCDFVSLAPASGDQCTQLGVATCSVGEVIQLVLWDVKMAIPVQTFCPGIHSKDVMLHKQQAWADKWVLVKPSWGLDFVSVSEDRTRLGFFAAGANKGIIYDTEKRIERLWISLEDKEGTVDLSLCTDMDFVLSPHGDKFVTLCESTIMIWLPQVLQKREENGASWVSLESSDSECEEGKLRCKFSRDGKVVGLMRLYCSVMDVWNLRTGRRIVLRQESATPTVETVPPPPLDDTENPQYLEGMQMKPLPSAVKSVATAQKRWFCQFCISKHGDMVATCMGDMSVLLWDLVQEKPEFTQIATLQSRYCAAWGVCFTEGPDGDPINVVVCEDNGHLVWIAIHPNPRILARRDADGKKRCAFSDDGSRAVLMPDDIQVHVWDLIDRVKIFSCTYQVWLGRSGQIPFQHNISLDGKRALIGIDASGRSVVCNKDTTYLELKNMANERRVSLIPNNLTVNEDVSWFVTDEFRQFDIENPKKYQQSFKSLRSVSNKSGTQGLTPSLKKSSSLRSRRTHSSRVQFNPDDGSTVETVLSSASGPSGPSVASEQPTPVEGYPNIRERLSNEQLWDYLRDNSYTRLEISDEDFITDRLVVKDVSGVGSTKQIFFPGLRPDRFIVVSSDGTKIACMDQNNKLNVWSTHASYGCIPTSQMLINAANTDPRLLEAELDTYGPGIINYRDHTGLTLLLFAVYKKNIGLLNCLLSWAKRTGLKISLRDELTDSTYGTQALNALNLALGSRSPEVTRSIMKYLLEGVCTEVETSLILKDSLVKLSGVYPSILLKILDNRRIMMRLHELPVPEWAFARSEYKVESSHQFIPTPGRLEVMWLKERLAKQEGLFRRPAFKRTSAYACVMPYPDIAQLGMDGILRPLLFNKVPHHIFATWPIRCVIKYKWGLYGKRLVVEDCVHYLALLFFFTLYALLIGFLVDHKDEDNTLEKAKFYEDGTVAVLTICVLLSFGLLMRKFHQLNVMWQSGRWKGVLYWLYDSFNLLELVCYIFVVILVPAAHLRDVRSRLLATFVAATCIMMWSKTLYYAQAFKKTGPLVIMIREIIRDIRFYLFLMFAILMGFAIAFFVLFRNARFEECRDRDLQEGETCTTDDINELFGAFDKTLITMFVMMLGEVSSVAGLLFEVKTGLKLVGIVMFILYMLAVTIVLLNLLIAIMGDGFDRVKAMDMSYFLTKRAQIIDDMETGLTQGRAKAISAQIGTYLHVLMPKHKSEIQQQTGEWQGRMKDAQQRFKTDVVRYFKQYSESLKELGENQNRMERKIEELRQSAPLRPRLGSTEVSQTMTSGMQSRGHGGGRPMQTEERSEESDLDDIFGDDSDADTV